MGKNYPILTISSWDGANFLWARAKTLELQNPRTRSASAQKKPVRAHFELSGWALGWHWTYCGNFQETTPRDQVTAKKKPAKFKLDPLCEHCTALWIRSSAANAAAISQDVPPLHFAIIYPLLANCSPRRCLQYIIPIQGRSVTRSLIPDQTTQLLCGPFQYYFYCRPPEAISKWPL